MTPPRPLRRLKVMFSVASQHSSSVHGWPADRWPDAAPAPDDERALVRALRARDEHAFAELVRRHHASLIRVARLYVADRAVAEEVAQETWLAVFVEIDDFQERCSLR